MALTDIHGVEGDSSFILELPVANTPPYAPVDILFNADNQLDFVLERPAGTLNAPVDITTDGYAQDVPVYELVLVSTGGEILGGNVV